MTPQKATHAFHQNFRGTAGNLVIDLATATRTAAFTNAVDCCSEWPTVLCWTSSCRSAARISRYFSQSLSVRSRQ